jgi:hypothetical protein
VAEGPEVETDKLQEAIHETLERDGGAFLRRIALTTALLAACAAVASLEAGATVNEALMLKTEATRDQAEASDQWTYYQAKGIKAAVQEANRNAWVALGKPAPVEFEQTAARYNREQQEIQEKAQAKEHDRDHKSEEAGRLLERHHGFANAVALFQIAIALGAVAALTRLQSVWTASMIVGVGGIVMFAIQWMR